ncbi:MAG: DegT/DnrJ/EryC1/StrS family aminotransferase [Deltaproteobacteria bacterium]|nr:MAG: DegT/DnrJ/EryC1/StrS family aminotransferase [Deltaproteobacteria bacterium]
MDFINLKAQYEAYRDEIEKEIRDVISSQRFILGEKGRTLEETLARYAGMKFAVGCGSGTDALILSLMALGVGKGDEVITTPFTFIATAEAVALLGARPVFVDIDPETFNIDPSAVEEKITVRTRGIIAVDIFGHPADYERLREVASDYGLFVVQDGAQSFGAKRNGLTSPGMGDVGITSFFPAKPLGCFGEGGMVFTNDERIAKKVEALRNHGQTGRYVHRYLGKNSRLDELQAAVLLAKFRHFDEEIRLRQKKAQRYREGLDGTVRFQKVEEGVLSTFAQFTILHDDRDALARYLADRGIPTAIHYPTPLHLQECFSYLEYREGDFPVAEDISRKVLSLPFSAFITEEEQERVIRAVVTFSG